MSYKIEQFQVESILDKGPFQVESFAMRIDDQPLEHRYYRLRCPDWINVLPVRRDGQAILIRQPRAGILAGALETPGGTVDANEERDLMGAALRELEEETGYTSRRVLPLGTSFANPAIQDNKVHLFLALDCFLAEPRQHFPDAEENISLRLVDVKHLESMVRHGELRHALTNLCVMLALRYLPPQTTP